MRCQTHFPVTSLAYRFRFGNGVTAVQHSLDPAQEPIATDGQRSAPGITRMTTQHIRAAVRLALASNTRVEMVAGDVSDHEDTGTPLASARLCAELTVKHGHKLSPSQYSRALCIAESELTRLATSNRNCFRIRLSLRTWTVPVRL